MSDEHICAILEKKFLNHSLILHLRETEDDKIIFFQVFTYELGVLNKIRLEVFSN